MTEGGDRSGEHRKGECNVIVVHERRGSADQNRSEMARRDGANFAGFDRDASRDRVRIFSEPACDRTPTPHALIAAPSGSARLAGHTL